MDDTISVAASASDEEALTPLDPAYKTLLRLNIALVAVGLLIAALVLELQYVVPTGLPLGAWLVFAIVALGVLPIRRFHARGYRMDADRLRVVRGVLFHSDTVVPFGRVQHIDVDQGPLERLLGLARLTLHTAGTHNSSVKLPGLRHEHALAMRETIRAAIKRDTM